ncbi:FAD-binding oxidoreductase [Candidatus Magnetaquicoccus inordinatus]|uniref:FAD-binding oxidoreductase n=1 Tax=Candidatus Magnetaquicoccus inordinatus TaxID=2496818 RepID=UPI00102B73E1|nr:FAD-linked oxidase C-terminal domain-containing protein [Candidatus Magnetaquicoccus inordinatus]
MNPSLPSPRPVPDAEHFARLLERLRHALSAEQVLQSVAEREVYAWDNTGSRFPPWAVVLAESSADVQETLRLCHEAQVAVIPRGAGTGNVGGALAVQGGIVLSLQRMNRIVEVSREDRLAVVEPGVVHGQLQAQLKNEGLFWPPDPSSSRSCSLGGNLAMCAAGANAVRYGVTRDWVLGLQAVLMDGSLLTTGGRTTKGVVGYDLTGLLIGSEGTLAVVTQATLKLAPLPESRRLLRVLFASVEEATQAVCLLMAEGEAPTAIEFLDASALDLLRRSGAVLLPEQGKALLLIELSGSAAGMESQVAAVLARLQRLSCLELLQAGPEEASTIWAARYALSPTLKKLAPKRINEDVVVPVSRLPELLAGVEELSKEYAIPIVNFGHAGNGNIHVNLLVDPAHAEQMAVVEPLLARLFRLVLSLQGSLSGEHGVGMQKKPYVAWELDPLSLRIQQQLKALFDPLGLLNPGKIFPDSVPQ